MSGILWLASYPKSGNTWLRALLANYLNNPDAPVSINALPEFVFGDAQRVHYDQVAGRSVIGASIEEIQALRLEVHRFLANAGPDTVLVKTHNAIALLDDVLSINAEVTAGAIYVLRNPHDVAVSYAHHYGVTFDRAIEALGSEETAIPEHGDSVFQYLGSWSGHVLSWTDAPGLNPHVVRYEDLAHKANRTLRGVLDYLHLPATPARIKKAIRFSSFRELSRQEREGGFVEGAPDGNRTFFRAGRIGAWRESLGREQAARITADHREVMRRHGYLGKDDDTPVF